MEKCGNVRHYRCWIRLAFSFPVHGQINKEIDQISPHNFSRFRMPYMVVSDNGKELVSKDLKDWLADQCCYKSDSPFYSPKSIGLVKWAFPILNSGLNCFDRNIGCSLGTSIDKVLLSQRNFLKAPGNTPAKLLLGRNLRNPILGLYDVGQKIMYKPPINNEPKEFTYMMRKGWKTALLRDNNWTILASDGKIASILTTTEIKIELSPNNGNVVAEVPLFPFLNPSDKLDTVPPELNLTHRKATARPQWKWTKTLRYKAGFSWWTDVVTSLPTTENNYEREPRKRLVAHCCTPNTETKYIRLTKQKWRNWRIPSETQIHRSMKTRTLLLHNEINF